jgi:UDP-N-acetylmuramoylalanine--D-glutamate ligase
MKIAIAGYGLEGESNYRYYSANPSNQITIIDQNQPERKLPVGVDAVIGEDAFEKLSGFDLVVRTAGLSPRKIKTNGKIWSSTNEFFAKCPCQIIGVTGSKGKGTTASLVAIILEAAGRRVWLIGNIGKPALEIIDQIESDDLVVYELSSFQLWDLEYSPHIAIVLYIEQEHLDIHKDMTEYIKAKANITKYQNHQDVLIYNRFNDYAKDIASRSRARLVGYADNNSAHVDNGSFYHGEQIICSTNALQIVGKHNFDNTCAAIDAVWEYTHDVSVIEVGIRLFKGLPHRLKFIRELDGVKFFDDSIATTPNATIAALRSFSQPIVVILGGSSKGSDFSMLGRELVRGDVSAIIIGHEAEKITQACQVAGFSNYEIMHQPKMTEIVERAKSLAKPGGVVLLSPACASFGLFKNYSDRGEQFIDAVNSL